VVGSRTITAAVFFAVTVLITFLLVVVVDIVVVDTLSTDFGEFQRLSQEVLVVDSTAMDRVCEVGAQRWSVYAFARKGSAGSIHPVAPLTFVSKAGLRYRDVCSLLTRPTGRPEDFLKQKESADPIYSSCVCTADKNNTRNSL
jgi:hypothetical protein